MGAAAALRRGATPGSALATASVVTTLALLLLLPHTTDTRAPLPGVAPSPSRTATAVDLVAAQQPSARGQLDRSTTAQVGTVIGRTRRPGRPLPSPQPTPDVVVPVVGLGVGTYERDDGAVSANPVERLQHCLEHLRVTSTYTGCSSPAPNPSRTP